MTNVLDVLFPARCACCRSRGHWLCPACIDSFPYIRPPICTRCGASLSGSSSKHACHTTTGALSGIRAVCSFEGPIRVAVHQYKYGGLRVLAGPLSAILEQYLKDHPLKARLLVPVPLHSNRLRDRGYNQAALLASELSARSGREVLLDRLFRERDTAPQVELPGDRRRSNVDGAFRWRGEDLKGENVLLVDDVSTTGATLSACAQALKLAGSGSIWGLVLARGKSQIRESIWIDHALACQHYFWGSIFDRESEELRSLADGMESF